MSTQLQKDHALAKAIFAWFVKEFGLGSTYNDRDVIELTKLIRRPPGAVKTRSQIKNPLTGTWTKRDEKSG